MSIMKEAHIQFNFKARYYKLGEINPDTRQVWFVVHGYGQLAQYFIKKFQVLSDKGICVIAPEGLSRFYLEDMATRMAGGTNRVGATWMTRENREMDIENYIQYLQTVYDFEIGANKNISVSILGFSQGGATTTRWALSGMPRFDRFILWAGIFPQDMDFEAGKEILKGKEVITVFGDDDPFITPARVDEMNMLCAKLNLIPKKVTFKGKHELDNKVLLDLAQL